MQTAKIQFSLSQVRASSFYRLKCTIITLKYWDRYAFANSVEPDQMLQNAASDLALHCHTHSNILDTSRGSRMDHFKI